MIKLLRNTFAIILLTAISLPSFSASVDDLAWMSGSWAGPAGPGVLEENWIKPTGGSIASLVRMTGGGSTSMVELIVIENDQDSLILHIQQWDPGYKPRASGPQTMKLIGMGERQVSFEAVTAGGLKTLSYSSPTDDTFNIDIENSEGAKFQLNLKAR